MPPRLLLLETSSSQAVIALAQGERVIEVRTLDEARRHARDLAPTVLALFTAHGWKPRDVEAVVVGRGPGSYTGLRVGLMSAKAFAYATDCAVIALDTFAVLPHQCPPEAQRVLVIADAQQDKIYAQPFQRIADRLEEAAPLTIQPLQQVLANLDASTWVTGPGLRRHNARLPAGQSVVAEHAWTPHAETLAQIGARSYLAGERSDPWGLEPLYLRPSSAEEQWEKLKSP